MLSEAFAYEWYDAKNNMYYFGKHNGSDPNYAHSSSVMPAFKMNTKPDHMHRTIMATGTNEEIALLEHTVLKNLRADTELWKQYYNIALGDPNYVPMDGENNNNYKDGKYTDRLNDPELYAKLCAIDHVKNWPAKGVYDRPRQMFSHYAKKQKREEAEIEWNLWYKYHPKKGKQAKSIQAGDSFELWYNFVQDHLHIHNAVMTKEYRLNQHNWKRR
jgi:hypothetical protein